MKKSNFVYFKHAPSFIETKAERILVYRDGVLALLVPNKINGRGAIPADGKLKTKYQTKRIGMWFQNSDLVAGWMS